MISGAIKDPENESIRAVFGKVILEGLLDWEVKFGRILILTCVPISHNVCLFIIISDTLARVNATNQCLLSMRVRLTHSSLNLVKFGLQTIVGRIKQLDDFLKA